MHSNSATVQEAGGFSASASAVAQRWLLCSLLIFCFFCGFFHVSDVDVGYHIRTGEHIMAGHGVPAYNTFSSTVPDEPWLAQQWLPATLYSWIHRVGGLAALTTFKALLATLLMFLVWRSARNVSGPDSLWPLCLTTVAVLILRARFFERPDLFTSTFFALTILFDAKFGRDRRWQWILLPVLMALWANMHAGYVYGFVLLNASTGAEWLEFFLRKWRTNDEAAAALSSWRALLIRPAGILLSGIGAIISVELINPNGWKVLTVPFTQFLSKFWQSVIVEYFPPTWASSKLLYLWAAALVILQIITWRQMRWRYLLATLAFGYFAFSSQRSLSAFIIVSVPHAAHMLGNLPRFEMEALARLPRLLSARLLFPVSWSALLALVIVPDRTFQFGVGLYHPYYPTEIFRFMEREVPPQNIFNDMRFGGPMLWTLYPRFKPYIDGRGDAYSEEFWKTEYLPAVQGEDKWEGLFQKYGVTAALLSIPSPTKVPRLAKALFERSDWALVAYNDETLLFLKRTEANRPLIQRHSFTYLWPGDWNFGAINSTNLATMAPEATRAWELHPGIYARAAVARCALVAGDFANASELFRTLVQQPDASAAFWQDYAYCLYASRQSAQAERVLTDMIHKGLAVGFAYYLKHFIALENRQPEQAKALLARALASEPNNPSYRQAWLRFEPKSTADSGRRS